MTRRASISGPLSETDETMAFLVSYGWAMWAVQQFEHDLAVLGILRAPVKSPGRRLDSPRKMYSALEKQFATYQHRFERASARELRQLLPEDLPEPLRSNLDGLVDARNDLAHRYVRRTLDEKPSDLRGAVKHVQALGKRFADASEQLQALAVAAAPVRPPNLTDEQYEMIQRLGRAAAAGTPLDEALGS